MPEFFVLALMHGKSGRYLQSAMLPAHNTVNLSSDKAL